MSVFDDLLNDVREQTRLLRGLSRAVFSIAVDTVEAHLERCRQR